MAATSPQLAQFKRAMVDLGHFYLFWVSVYVLVIYGPHQQPPAATPNLLVNQTFNDTNTETDDGWRWSASYLWFTLYVTVDLLYVLSQAVTVCLRQPQYSPVAATAATATTLAPRLGEYFHSKLTYGFCFTGITILSLEPILSIEQGVVGHRLRSALFFLTLALFCLIVFRDVF